MREVVKRTKTYLKVRDICEHVEEKYGIKYTVAGIPSCLKNHKFSFIKPHFIPAKTDHLQQKQFIDAYENFNANTPVDEPIIFPDAGHPTMETNVTYGWIRKGTRQLIKPTTSKAG